MDAGQRGRPRRQARIVATIIAPRLSVTRARSAECSATPFFIDFSSPGRVAVIGPSDHREREPVHRSGAQPRPAANDFGPVWRSAARATSRPRTGRAGRPVSAGDGVRRRARESRGAARNDDNAEQQLLAQSLGRIGAADRSARLRELHARPRGAELPRPHEQRARQGEPAAARGEQLAVPVSLERLQSPAPERRQRAEPRPGATGEGAVVAVLPVRAQPRRPELPRPRPRRPHTRPEHGRDQSGLPEVRGRKPSLPELSAALHALERRLQRLRQDAWLTSPATEREKPRDDDRDGRTQRRAGARRRRLLPARA